MKIFFVSLGCDKNLVDSEMMLGELSKAGHEIVDDETIADIAIVNSCSFISDAKKESIETLIEMGNLKKTSGLKGLICCGCLSQRYTEEIKEQLPEVDVIVGTMAIDEIVNAVKYIEDNYKEGLSVREYKKPIDGPLVYGKERLLTTGGHYAYLKISEGCDKHCTYCVIPSVRGKFRSVPKEELLREAKDLAEAGIKELILVAQETSIYGKDLYGKEVLPEFLKKLCQIDGIEWIRLLYCYPEDITEEFLQVMAQEKKICHYVDMPIQHASDQILKKMGRKTDRASILATIHRVREIMPDAALRTSLITGFPSESEEDHQLLMSFVKEARFDHLGVLTYSQEEGTPAAKMPDQIDVALKEQRKDDIMRLQEQISLEIMNEKIGRELQVLIDGYLPDEDVYIGRTRMDAPDVDGFFYVKAEESLNTGDLIIARVLTANAYDLYGEMIKRYESTE